MRGRAGVLVRVDGDGWKEALEEYKTVADDLHAGRTPRADPNALTVAALRAATQERPKPLQAHDVGRVFLSEAGTMLVTRSEKGHTKET